MPTVVSYPGVYIEEVPSGVRTITGVATSITAFIGRTRRGPANDPVRVQSFGEFERNFGGLWSESTLSYAVMQFFQNGGGDALIVRVSGGGDASTASVNKLVPGAADSAATGALSLVAVSTGDWGNSLRARIEPVPGGDDTVFNLTVLDTQAGTTEQFLNLSTDAASPRFVTDVLAQGSTLANVTGAVPAKLVAGVVKTTDPSKPPILDPALSKKFENGTDGNAIADSAISDPGLQVGKAGIWALDKADLFNLLCIPPLKLGVDISQTTRDAAATYCQKRRALFIVDPPAAWDTPAKAIAGVAGSFMTRNSNSALFFPQLRASDPQKAGQIGIFAPCGAVAGIFARTDATRGVWKAPAGLEATISGVAGLSVKLTDGENGQLNPLAINCLRSFPNFGTVVWGSRTLDGYDQLGSEWKYVPVRRLALFIEESLFRGTQWVVFEPNDEPLWAQVRLNLGAFMHNLFRQGAFQGKTPAEAYFVKCDKDTTTQNDINLGIVNIVVGFAPLKPAEFVVIKIQQIAGDIAT
ncbi:phage tail sheath family protein [Inquilinus sp.]|jgi:phage tail sheath protein FI|uniref:phage tail sheath family protein n=1 Tax=Inquilinus sp. TaxID=1932117 RepID=UPI003784AB96